MNTYLAPTLEILYEYENELERLYIHCKTYKYSWTNKADAYTTHSGKTELSKYGIQTLILNNITRKTITGCKVRIPEYLIPWTITDTICAYNIVCEYVKFPEHFTPSFVKGVLEDV